MMPKSSKWTIKLALLCAGLASAAAHAKEDWSISHSGFITYTAFSDPSFYPNAGKLALNIGAERGELALRAQITDQGFSRWALEYGIPAFQRNFLVQVGRVPRLTTFHSDIFGSPAEWGMAVLPLASYNRRMVHAQAFNAVEGVRVQQHLALGGHSLRLAAVTGRLSSQDDCALQQEFSKAPACDPQWRIVGTPGSYAVSAQGEQGRFQWLVSVDRFQAKTELTVPPGIKPSRSALLSTQIIAPRIDYRVYRWGLKWSDVDWYVQAEGTDNRTRTSTLGLMSSAFDGSVTLGLRLERWTPFMNLAYGRGHAEGSRPSRDRALGLTYLTDDWAATIQHNRGTGSWKRLDTPETDWNTTSAAVTYRFK